MILKSRKQVFVAVLVGLVFLGWSIWTWAFPVSEINYRLDVTFEVDGKPVTGSGVQKLIVSRVRGLSQKNAGWRVFGDAVVVDLPGHESVFVLLKILKPSDQGYLHGRYDFLVSDACKLKERRGDRDWSDYVRFVGEVSGTCDIPSGSLPLMVRFGDEAVPASVERIDPNNVHDTFGPNVEFIGASVTITDDPVTTGIGDRLKWLSEHTQRFIVKGPPSTAPPFPQIIQHGYFRRFEK